MKHLPPGMTAFELYDLVRPFGPVEYVEVNPDIGGILHFKDEATARNVELSLAGLALRPYDTTKLFCTVRSTVHLRPGDFVHRIIEPLSVKRDGPERASYRSTSAP